MVEVKNFHFLKRPFLTKKDKWFFVTLRGGRGGVRASVTFVTKKMFFFLKASLSKTGCSPVSDVVVVEAVGGKVEEASGVVESKDFGFMTISPRQHSSYVEYRNLDFLKPVFHIIGERFC